MILDRPRKTGETFVVAHRWHIAWDDRRYRTVGLNDRHQVTSQNRNRRSKHHTRIRRFGVRRLTRINLVASGVQAPNAGLLRPRGGLIPLCKPQGLCYTQPGAKHWFALFLGSSVVEQPAVNRLVAGSNPARGAKPHALPRYFRRNSRDRARVTLRAGLPISRKQTARSRTPIVCIKKAYRTRSLPFGLACSSSHRETRRLERRLRLAATRRSEAMRCASAPDRCCSP